MLEPMERAIREQAASWRLELPRERLRAVLRSNPENDGIVREFAAGQIGTIVFWFRPGERKPFLVAKILGAALTEAAVMECRELQRSANRSLGYDLFPAIHGVMQIAGARVVFMEPVEGPNYEVQLARAVAGPERSYDALCRVVAQQLQELGGAVRGLQAAGASGEEVRWGSAAAAAARRFLDLCPAAAASVSGERIARMAGLIDTMPLRTHFVLSEDHMANYLPGPRAVDQLVPDVRALCTQWPGPVSGLRLLLGFFRASPVRAAYKAFPWLDALAACAAHGERVEVLGPPVRRYLEDIGLGGASREVLWAFVSAVFFMRASQEIEFHSRNAKAAAVREEYLGLAADLERLAGLLSRDAAQVPIPRVDRDQLDGEFRGRDDPEFFRPPQLAVPVPKWLAAIARFQYWAQERHAGAYRAVRWLYRLPLGVVERLGRR